MMIISLLLQIGLGGSELHAQKALQKRMGIPRDSLKALTIVPKDSILTDSLAKRNQEELQLFLHDDFLLVPRW